MANFVPGDLLAFHQNAPGIKSGCRLVVGEGTEPPLKFADRFEVYRPTSLMLAVGDRVRVTANNRTKDGKHRLDNGSLYTIQGFTPRGDVIVDHGWVIGTAGGVHLNHGYAVTSSCQPGQNRGQGIHWTVEPVASRGDPAEPVRGCDPWARAGADLHRRQAGTGTDRSETGRAALGRRPGTLAARPGRFPTAPRQAPGVPLPEEDVPADARCAFGGTGANGIPDTGGGQ